MAFLLGLKSIAKNAILNAGWLKTLISFQPLAIFSEAVYFKGCCFLSFMFFRVPARKIFLCFFSITTKPRKYCLVA